MMRLAATMVSILAVGLAYGQSSKFQAPKSSQFKRALVFRPFDMVNATGKPIKPTDTLTLSNGKVVSAKDFYDSLNRIEKGLNASGYSLRDPEVSVVKTNYADTALHQQQFSEYKALVKPPTFSRDQVRRALIRMPVAPKVMAMTVRGKGNQGRQYGTKFNPNSQVGELLLTTDNSGTKVSSTDANTNYYWPFDKQFGDANLGVRLIANVSVHASTQAPANADQHGAKTNINAGFTGAVKGTLLGQSFNILDATCRAGTSSDSTQVYTQFKVSVGGFEVLNEQPSFKDGISWSDTYSIPFQQQSQTVEYPIFGPFACSGFVGVEGEAGVTANVNLNPIYLEADVQPYAKAGVYGEVDAGLDVEVASAWGGLHANLTLVNDTFTLGANTGLVAMPGNKLGWRDEVYVQNNLTLFHGDLSLAVHIYGPGGTNLFSHLYPFYTVPGYSFNGTLYQTGTTTPLNWTAN